VVLETGRGRLRRCFEVKAPLVVAAGDLRDCVNRLIGRESFEAEYLARLDGLKPSYACYLMHLGLRGIARARLEEIQGYHWVDWDTERMGQDSLKFKLFVPTQFEPRMAPPGGEVLIVQKVLEFDYDAVTDWQTHKTQVDEFVWTELRRLAPELEAATVTWSSASALTSQRYTGNYQGAMLGWEMSPEQLGTARPAQHSPIEGLYLSGHWTQPGGGITPVIVSAMRVAEAILGVRERATEALHEASFAAPRRLRGVAS
jgi:phytoene dehydrogenase-like protein